MAMHLISKYAEVTMLAEKLSENIVLSIYQALQS